MVRTSANANNSNFLTQTEIAFQIRKSLEGTHSIIDMCLKNYEGTGDLNALKIALDGIVTLHEMLKQVEEFYGSYGHGHDFELTK